MLFYLSMPHLIILKIEVYMIVKDDFSAKEQESPDFSEFFPTTYDDWAKAVQDASSGKGPDKLISMRYEEIELKPIYQKKDIANYLSIENNFPGFPPYTRGTESTSYKQKQWKISQIVEAPNSIEFNKKAKESIKNGQSALCFVPQDNSINTIESLKTALTDIDICKIQLDIFSKEHSPEFYHLFEQFVEESIAKPDSILGGFDYCPLSIASEKGCLPFSYEDAMKKAAKIAGKASKLIPNFRTIAVSTLPYHNAGANAVQETAYALATASAYMKSLIDNGLSPDLAASQIRFFVAAGENFFTEIAKFRALRRLWTKVSSEFNCSAEQQKINIFVISTKRNKSKLDPYVNLLRNTTEALSAIIGSCNTLQLSFFDEGLRTIGEFSERITRNIQIVLQEECNLADTSDPAGGAWYIEYLTEEISQRAWKHFTQIEAKGGMLQQLSKSAIQDEIAHIRNQRFKNLSTRKDSLLGTNIYPNIFEKRLGDEIEDSTKITDNSHTDAAFSIKPLEMFRGSEPFEMLREKASNYKKLHSNFPEVLLLNFGELRDFKARADFSSDFLAVGGFQSIRSEALTTFESLAAKAIGSDCNIVVFCSSDEKYPDFVPQTARLIKRAKPLKTIVLAGYPKEYIDDFKAAGVDYFIHLRADIVDVLTALQNSINF